MSGSSRSGSGCTDAEAVKVKVGKRLNGPASQTGRAPAVPGLRPMPRYAARTPSMISIASVASMLNATRDVVITWIWPVLA